MNSIPRNPIVDTGPLFDFLLWRFSTSEYFKNSRPSFEFRCLKDDFAKKSVYWYFTKAKPITTCPQVITEINRHAQIFRGSLLGNFWRFAQHELTELGLSEKLVELVQMDGETLSSVGPTDAALLQMASESSPNSTQPIFTEDNKLAGHCRKRQISVLVISDVLTIWQRYGTQQ